MQVLERYFPSGAFGGAFYNLNTAVVGGDDIADDGEAGTGATFGAVAALGDDKKHVEDVIPVIRINADAIVLKENVEF